MSQNDAQCPLYRHSRLLNALRCYSRNVRKSVEEALDCSMVIEVCFNEHHDDLWRWSLEVPLCFIFDDEVPASFPLSLVMVGVAPLP